jgi:tRNA G18 (ribose-2'-O)-methylase SpoU
VVVVHEDEIRMMRPGIDSLNVAAASAVACYVTAGRQRQ